MRVLTSTPGANHPQSADLPPSHVNDPHPDRRDDAPSPRSSSATRARERRSGTMAEPRVNGANGSAPARPLMLRAKSDFGPRHNEHQDRDEDEHENGDAEWTIRHGWESQLTSEEYQNLLSSTFFMYFTDKKHETNGNPKDDSETYPLQEWRMKDRLKTVSAVLALCLNIGVDPPDVIKTNPCAKLECWIDPTISTGTSGHTPMNNIGKALQTQYEQLSMRTRYKLCLDPTVDETRRYCSTLRKNARNERVLFHYNGHGVPRPTSSGEIWVFNRNYTQYIPISLYDLQSWLGAPSLFVYDCSDAGLIIQNFNKFAEKHEQENAEVLRREPNAEIMDFSDCIHLAACREKETLPTNPDLPADVFTSCLTTPIEMAVRFFILQNPLPTGITLQDAANIPGRVSERRTPIGELNWIFTAITDTIAWNSLSKPLFKKLFRQDLMCYPEIPETHDHPLWKSWDLAVEMILAQLPNLIAAERGEKQYEYQHSNFFAEQLTAFEVYLDQGGAMEQRVPEQLPIVLQVLLSQVHRLRALILLSKFLDLGPWAVNLALSIGIFPYVLKLLQSQAMELKPVMVFIWARILAVDQSCQTDLLKDNGYTYFISILNPNSGIPIGNQSEHRAMCAFIVAMFCKDFHQGQVVSLSPDVFESCLGHLGDLHNPLLRQWSCLCLSMLWVDYPEAKWTGIQVQAHQRLLFLRTDPVAEVRASMLHALTTFLGIPDVTPQVAQIEESIAGNLLFMAHDGNSMVRKELLVFFSTFVARYDNKFVVAAFKQLQEERNALRKAHEGAEEVNGDAQVLGTRSSPQDGTESPSSLPQNTVFSAMWKDILILSVDPNPEVADNACIIVDYVLNAVLESPLASYAQALMDEIAQISAEAKKKAPRSSYADQSHSVPQPSQSAEPSTPSKQDGFLSAGMRRTASVAASLKNLAFGSHSSSDGSPVNSMKSPTRSNTVGSRGRIPSEWNRPPDEKDSIRTAASSNAPDKVPATRTYRRRNLHQKPSIPLKSKFFEWSAEYFREPQMKPTEADEPGSMDYNMRLWRRNRNDKIIAETQPLKDVAGSNRWDRPKGFFNNGSQPMKMCFHQFEEHLIVTDDSDTVCVWDWERQTRLNRFSNGNPVGSKMTEVKFINEDDQALLMTGSSDGVIKLYRDYENPNKVELVSAFRALTDLVPSNRYAGLVFDWQQGRGHILVAGDVRVIRVWNAGSETCTQDINARSGSCITSLTSDQVEGQVFAAGFGDGAVRIYDQRMEKKREMVKVWKEHKQWITNIHLQRGGQRELVSACRDGEVKLWDIRMDRSVKTVQATRDTLRSLSVHEHAPVFAVGTERHVVKLMNLNSGKHLSNFEPYSGFLQNKRYTPISTTAFHPHRMMIAGSALHDSHINIYECSGLGNYLDGDRE
ncbi:Target of rapamycin complex 1 subunit mip1 [Lasiodiplodia theobromae]|uniref:Target of rapamycin complex 1 subunit mip1 n=1 Tax=Lasiodiplodia theobromae TaxID=45133 RepID=UPI0015C2E60D|nr:Target of rapamycin complex 1 subunit mip1 [Lasiodiplodia theobromae]KAF4540051.1 Target of rapamycin complex 1 subunit mip1 [Lasiodiplodia theobromae]